ncbi:uncharacterized protein CMU_033120 [Cryptosporidium muris RN66]|uniref:Uncharacterized protein n=1 Tax=Cryptosporidium muris (strain RN66) TaxID=441375 RepID=B6AFD6_CRYMR|nr:uncharacterized protein CMU_033120 [Cryptosporidium muris RN66]EEA06927.1 hypothetical protein, conserved [Cryptosporidium muris RN66]|eukprot:XP_002141276.1 hypothetical protein [Cryptosporidium muris RN66]
MTRAPFQSTSPRNLEFLPNLTKLGGLTDTSSISQNKLEKQLRNLRKKAENGDYNTISNQTENSSNSGEQVNAISTSNSTYLPITNTPRGSLISTLQAELASLRREHSTLEKQYKREFLKRADLENLQQIVKDQKLQIRELRNQLSDEKRRLLNKEKISKSNSSTNLNTVEQWKEKYMKSENEKLLKCSQLTEKENQCIQLLRKVDILHDQLKEFKLLKEQVKDQNLLTKELQSRERCLIEQNKVNLDKSVEVEIHLEQMNEYQMELINLRSQVEELTKEKKISEEERIKYVEDHNMKNKLLEVEKLNVQLEKDIQDLHLVEQRLNNEVSRLEDINQVTTSDFEELKFTNKLVQEELDKVTSERNELLNLNLKLKTNISELNIENNKLKEELSELNKKQEQTISEISKANALLKEFEGIGLENNQLKDKLNINETEIKEMKSYINNLELKIDKFKIEKQIIQQQKSEINELKILNRANEVRLSEMSDLKTNLESENKKNQEIIDEMKKKYATLELTKINIHSNYDSTIKELEELKETNLIYGVHIFEANKINILLTQELEESKKIGDSLRGRLTQVEEELRNKTDITINCGCEELLTKNQSLIEELDSLNSEFEKTRNTTVNEKMQLSQEIDHLNNKLKQLQDRKEELTSELKNKEIELNKLSEINKTISEKEYNLNMVKEELTTCLAELGDRNQLLENTRNDLNELKELNTTLETKVTTLMTEINCRDLRNIELRNELKKLLYGSEQAKDFINSCIRKSEDTDLPYIIETISQYIRDMESKCVNLDKYNYLKVEYSIEYQNGIEIIDNSQECNVDSVIREHLEEFRDQNRRFLERIFTLENLITYISKEKESLNMRLQEFEGYNCSNLLRNCNDHSNYLTPVSPVDTASYTRPKCDVLNYTDANNKVKHKYVQNLRNEILYLKNMNKELIDQLSKKEILLFSCTRYENNVDLNSDYYKLRLERLENELLNIYANMMYNNQGDYCLEGKSKCKTCKYIEDMYHNYINK